MSLQNLDNVYFLVLTNLIWCRISAINSIYMFFPWRIDEEMKFSIREWRGWEDEVFYLDHPSTCKWLGSPPCISHLGHLEGVPPPYLGLTITMVINHLLSGMILQVSYRSVAQIGCLLLFFSFGPPENPTIFVKRIRNYESIKLTNRNGQRLDIESFFLEDILL